MSLVLAGQAAAARMPSSWHAPSWWLREAVCIHRHEGSWVSIGYVHRVATYGGGMQFLVSTWQAAGGAEGSVWAIARAPIREQLYRAYVTWDRTSGRPHDGVGSWSQWGTAGACGLR